jgi:hypothetical protein
MPWRFTANRARIDFMTSAAMPSQIYKAAKAKGFFSNTHYIQVALCEALARDLDMPLEELIAALPPHRGQERGFVQKYPARVGPKNTVEEVT